MLYCGGKLDGLNLTFECVPYCLDGIDLENAIWQHVQSNLIMFDFFLSVLIVMR